MKSIQQFDLANEAKIVDSLMAQGVSEHDAAVHVGELKRHAIWFTYEVLRQVGLKRTFLGFITISFDITKVKHIVEKVAGGPNPYESGLPFDVELD